MSLVKEVRDLLNVPEYVKVASFFKELHQEIMEDDALKKTVGTGAAFGAPLGGMAHFNSRLEPIATAIKGNLKSNPSLADSIMRNSFGSNKFRKTLFKDTLLHSLKGGLKGGATALGTLLLYKQLLGE